ncbi:hypothetical protein A2U01_0025525, partial [Trifolium medium]|nr:hypothetical protein [Trifolium medium]
MNIKIYRIDNISEESEPFQKRKLVGAAEIVVCKDVGKGELCDPPDPVRLPRKSGIAGR